MAGASVATSWLGLTVHPGQAVGRLRKAIVFSWTNKLTPAAEKGSGLGLPWSVLEAEGCREDQLL